MYTREMSRRVSGRPVTTAVVSLGALVALLTGAIGTATSPTASAQEPTAPSTSTTVPRDPAASAPAPGDTAPGDTSPRDTAPGDTVPVDPNAPTTTLVPDPLGGASEGLSQGAYGTQPPFDLGSMSVLGAEVRRTRRDLATAQARYDAAQGAIDATLGEFERLAQQIEVIGLDREDKVADASAAKATMQRRVVEAYVRGDRSTSLLGVAGDPAEYSRAKSYLEVMADLDRESVEGYRRSVGRMNDSERRLVDDQAALQQRATALTVERDAALQALLDARRCAEAYRTGSHACPPTFTFPVLGEVTFVNSWGAARLPGSPDQHWHEGTDIMAPQGREIVAVEDGTLFKVGEAGLGGMRLWLHGASGLDYYYAHFSAFAPGIVDGLAVTAGTVVGYAGSTGDAAGGASHLHFEIHPSGGAPIDPYPLLKAAWGTRPMPLQSFVMDRPASAMAVLPAEER